MRLGPKRPPMAAGVRADGTGVMRVVADARHRRCHLSRRAPLGGRGSVAWSARRSRPRSGPRAGPRRPSCCRPWPEDPEVTTPAGARASARVAVDGDGRPSLVEVRVACGPPLDEVTLRSYVTGAAHMALGWVCSEAIAVDEAGVPEDLTIRSFGILRARETPAINIEVVVVGGPDEPVPGSDAVFAAVAAAAWRAQGLPSRWPTRRGG